MNVKKILSVDLIFLVLLIFWQILIYFRLERFIWDDGLVEPWFVTKGLMFHKDFYSTYLPALKILMIPIQIIFNWNPATTVILGLIIVIGTLVLLYKMSGLFFKGVPRIISLFFFSTWLNFIFGHNGFENNLFIGSLILSAIYLLFLYLKKPEKYKVFLISIVLSFAFFTTQYTIISIVLIYLMLTFYFISKRKSLKFYIFNFLTPSISGFLIIALPILLLYWYKNALGDLYFWTVDYYFRENGYPVKNWGRSSKDLLMLTMLVTPIFISTFYFKKILALKENYNYFILYLVIVTAVISSFFAVFHPRRFLYFLPGLSLISGFSFQFIRQEKNKIKKLFTVALLLPLSVYLFTITLPWYSSSIIKGSKYDYYNRPHPGDNAFEAINWIKNNTPIHSTLFLFSGNLTFYFETQRLPAISRTYSNPWVYEPFNETIKLLEEKPANYWLVDERLFKRYNEWGYPHQSEYIRQYLNKNYKKVTNFDWMSIYEKN